MKKNFIYNIIYQILILFLPLITMPYISRTLGAEGIGVYSYTYSIAYYFMLIAMLGLNNYGNRAIAKVREDKKELSKNFWSIYIFQLISTIIMIILYLIYIKIFQTQYKLIALIQVIHVISSMFDINWFFFGIERFKLTITRNTIIKISSVILIFIFVKNPNDVWKYTTILSVSTLFSNIILFSFLRKYVYWVDITKSDVLKHLKPNLIMFLPVIAVSIYKIMDKIMLGIISTVTEVGYYENAEKIAQIPLTIITALGTVTLPRVSNMISKDQEDKVKLLMDKTMPFIMFLAFPMTFGIIAISTDFSIIFFGDGFLKTGYLIQLLSITLIFLSWGNVIRTQYLLPKEMDKEYVVSAFLGAFINFFLNIFFIPRYSSFGACVGTITAEFFVMFYQTFSVRHELDIKKYFKIAFIFFIKAIMMFIFIMIIGNFINDKIIKIFIQVIIGIIFYVIINLRYIFNIIDFDKILNKLRKEAI